MYHASWIWFAVWSITERDMDKDHINGGQI